MTCVAKALTFESFAKDEKAGFDLVHAAAERGHAPAQFNLALCLGTLYSTKNKMQQIPNAAQKTKQKCSKCQIQYK